MGAFGWALGLVRSLAKTLVEPIRRVFRARIPRTEVKSFIGQNAAADAAVSTDDVPREGREARNLRSTIGAREALSVRIASLDGHTNDEPAPASQNVNEEAGYIVAGKESDIAPDGVEFPGLVSLLNEGAEQLAETLLPAMSAQEVPLDAIGQETTNPPEDAAPSPSNEPSSKEPFASSLPEFSLEQENDDDGNSGADHATRSDPAEGDTAGPAVAQSDERIQIATPDAAVGEPTSVPTNLERLAGAREPEISAPPSSSLQDPGSHFPQAQRPSGVRTDKRQEANPTEPTVVEVQKADAEPLADLDEVPAAPRIPRQYKPTNRGTLPPRAKPQTPSKRANLSAKRALPISVRILFERGAFCKISFLPRKTAGLPDEVAVTGSKASTEFRTLQDGWYQDVIVPDTGRLLREGIEWEGVLGKGQRERWSLGGRELYVLAPHADLSGFVSTPRLVLGEDHVVLCTAERLQEVMKSVALAGSPVPTVLTEINGVPAGWVALRGVAPQKSVPHSSEGADLFDALRPLAEASIVLVGGIRIERQTWLAGHPPTIRIRGDVTAVGEVIIDGISSTPNSDGTYEVPGWNDRGPHQVWCSSMSRSYVIQDGAEAWSAWPAYKWSLGDTVSAPSPFNVAICGASVLTSRLGKQAPNSMVIVPASNPVLLGNAGQIYRCQVRTDLSARFCIGFPPFSPVWALPQELRRADKSINKILFVGYPQSDGDTLPPRFPSLRRRRGARTSVDDWCAAILDASRKHLPVEPSTASENQLWVEYKTKAKAIRKMRK